MERKKNTSPADAAKSLSIFSDVREVVEMSKKKDKSRVGRCHRREVEGILKEKKIPSSSSCQQPISVGQLV